tara:strand:- start:490 stop:612 length:123 start_codon:yes stop_codon:yes gene_type:complete
MLKVQLFILEALRGIIGCPLWLETALERVAVKRELEAMKA